MRIFKYFIWRLPRKIMKSGFSQLNLETKPITGTMPRRRPLHTCGTSVLAIAHNACTKAQDFDEPLGSMAKRAVIFFDLFFPFVYNMVYQWLAMLSFMDDHILNVEQKVEIIFPPSKRLFDKIDGLVCNAEVLPEQFDYVLRNFPMIMHQIPFLDWIVVHLISWLNFLVSILTRWGSKSIAREKEITVYVNSNNIHSCKPEPEEKAAYSLQEKANAARNHEHFQEIDKSLKRLEFLEHKAKAIAGPQIDAESPMYKSAVSSPLSDSSQDESEANSFGLREMSKPNSMKCTYKEMLERGKQEDSKRREEEEFP